MKSVDLVIWVGSVVIGIVLLIGLSTLVWIRKENTPILTAIDSYYYPIYELPFVAITFCNNNVVHRKSLQPIVNKL